MLIVGNVYITMYVFLIFRKIFCWFRKLFIPLYPNCKEMRIFTEQAIKRFTEEHPDSLTAFQVWVSVVKASRWTCYADIKKDFNSVDAVGNQRYVFNIMGNHYRLVVVIKFTIGFVYVRFVGTHTEYDKIDCKTI